MEKGGKDLPIPTLWGNLLIIIRENLKNGEDIPACVSLPPSIFNQSLLYALGNKNNCDSFYCGDLELN